MAFNPFATGQRLEQRAIEAASGTIINIFRRRLHAQPGEAQTGMQALGVALQSFAVDHQGDPFLEIESGAVRLAPHLLQGASHADKAKLA